MEKVRLYTKKFIRAVAFFLILVSLLVASGYMLMPKGNSGRDGIINPNARGFYAEPSNSIDVVMIGNSDAYSGFSPLELWHNYGITSYVSGEGRQRMSEAINVLNEVLQFHKPKLVILETDMIFTYDKGQYDGVIETIDYAAQGVLPVLRYHDRWKDVSVQEMFRQPEYKWHSYTKGQFTSNTVRPCDKEEYMIKTDDVRQISFSVRTFLDMFVKTCEDNGIKVLFVQIPSASSWKYEKHNAVQQYADSNGIPFIDYDIDRSQYGIDWETDTRDEGNHLNTRGARKITIHLGQYLKEHYDFLEDRRNDKELAKKWNADYKEYAKKATI
ncbi:MAG: SGNH/GDSL hydrolase family protein [Clostridia bacterium]|nr:SGNH/GDSL hydrolase family protein [Clostridia bacterium]